MYPTVNKNNARNVLQRKDKSLLYFFHGLLTTFLAYERIQRRQRTAAVDSSPSAL